MNRVQTWPDDLAAYIEQRRLMPFVWGQNDCCQFARYAVQALTGADPAKKWRRFGLRTYKTARGARGNLSRLGGIRELPVKAGLEAVALRLARRGDIVLIELKGRETLGVLLGADIAAPAAQGLTFYPARYGTLAWRVG